MTLKSQKEIDDAVSHSTLGKERKQELLAHARAAAGRGKLEEFHGIITSDESLKKGEVAFVTSIIDGKPSEPGTSETSTPENTTHAGSKK